MGEERLDALRWSGVVLAADRVGIAFDFTLEFEPAKEIVACRNGHGDCPICKRPVAAAVTHAVGGEGPGFRGAGHQDATRAHAETVGTAGFIQCRGGEEVFGGTRELGVYIQAQLAYVDERLRVLNAHAHGKRLTFESDATGVEHFVNAPGRMPDGEHQRFAGFPVGIR